MAEYINRDQILHDPMLHTYRKKDLLDKIKSMPAADVAPVVHGRWVIRDIETISQRGRKIKSRLLICSRCERSNGRAPKPYCPHCGAKMDLKNESEEK